MATRFSSFSVFLSLPLQIPYLGPAQFPGSWKIGDDRSEVKDECEDIPGVLRIDKARGFGNLCDALIIGTRTNQIHVRLLNITQNHNHVRLLNITHQTDL